MIVITVEHGSQKKKYSFTKRQITVGGAESQADISLEIKDLEPEHLLIEEEEGNYFAFNQSQDPSTLCNNLPFGKRLIGKGSTLKIKDVLLSIEYVDDLVQESFVLKKKPEPPPSIPPEEPSLFEPPSPESSTPPSTDSPKRKRRTLFWASLTLLALSFFIGSAFIYKHRESKKQGQYELTAARGLADNAAALFYAKMSHLTPSHQNWSDPHFIQVILDQILPMSTKTYFDVDQSGRFEDTPYLMRLYTNETGSHFILIAQPTPGLMTWKAQESYLILDSDDMVIRRINDIQPINRLLHAENELTDEVSLSIKREIYRAQPISLLRLAGQDPSNRFAPPRELFKLKPAAINKLYNAPRYYKLSALLVKDFETEGGVKSTLDRIGEASEQDLVLYSVGGVSEASDLQYKLFEMDPKREWIVGYLSPDSNNRAQLLKLHQDFREMRPQKVDQNQTGLPPEKARLFDPVIEAMHERSKGLAPLDKKLKELLGEQVQAPLYTFTDQFQETYSEFLATDLAEQKNIVKHLSTLYEQYVVNTHRLSKEEFRQALDSLGLHALLRSKKKSSPVTQ